MKIELAINSEVKCALSEKFFRNVITRTITASSIAVPKKITVSLGLVPAKEIRRVNRIYRKKDRVTDILSFCDENMWELVICCPYIEASAKKDEISLKKEMAYVVSHGILHCLGMKHSKKMYAIQDIVCSEFR